MQGRGQGRGSRTPAIDGARHATHYHPYAPAPTAGGSASTPPAEHLVHIKLQLKGDKPSFNDWQNFVVDHQRERVYTYGGVRPHDESYTPTCDFYCLDVKTMEWKNLTDSLRFRPKNHNPDPFCKNGPELELRPLPRLTEPAIALSSLGGGNFVFLCGGFNSQNPTSDLIVIDLDDNIWWFVDVPGTQIRPRMSACMVAVDNQLFIFGGRDQFDDDSPTIRTYSIAVYKPETRWTWMVSDAPMPPDLPFLGFGIQAVPVYDGQKILLTRGRIKNDTPIDLSRETTIFFHTQHYTFQDARATMGPFPTGISWLQLGSLVAGAPRPSAVSPRRRGRPPKYAPPVEVPTVPALPTHNFPPSVVIFAWVKLAADGDELVPEAWQYFLPPAERIRCLNLGRLLGELNLDLQSFIAVGNRLLLLGNQEGQKSLDAPSEAMQADKELPRWDVAVEISSKYLIPGS